MLPLKYFVKSPGLANYVAHAASVRLFLERVWLSTLPSMCFSPLPVSRYLREEASDAGENFKRIARRCASNNKKENHREIEVGLERRKHEAVGALITLMWIS